MTAYPYPPCITCGRPMRKGRHKKADHPGTIVHFARGICNTCHYRETGPKRKKQPIPGEPDPATLQSLSAYLQWRAPFRAKAGAL